MKGVILTGQTRLRFGSVWFTLVACAVKITFGSLWFNMTSVDIINFENKLRLGHVKVSSCNGYAFGLELGEHILPVCDSHRGTDVPACITTVSSSLKHYYTNERKHKFGGNIEVHV